MSRGNNAQTLDTIGPEALNSTQEGALVITPEVA